MEKLNIPKRKLIEANPEGLASVQYPATTIPVILSPALEGLDLIRFSSTYRDYILKKLLQAGAILFRGFEVKGVEYFREFLQSLSSTDLISYTNRSTPRTDIAENIYSSTEYPPDQTILQHNENSYSHTWPRKIWFHCVEPAAVGGSTPISDSRRVFQRIDPAIRRTFEEKGVMYVRNYGKLDLPWQEVFQTNSMQAVETYCKKSGMQFTWKENGDLQTRQVRQAVLKHPVTHEMVWFNQAHLFHVTALEPETYRALLSSILENEWPRNTYFGDGSPIDPEVLREIRQVYEGESIDFSWEKDDVLMLDNLLTAHGRRAYKGKRKVVVGMAEPHSI